MSCRFKGPFNPKEKERIEKAVRAVEKVLPQDTHNQSTWNFIHLKTPSNGYPYWGMRLVDGHLVHAKTAMGLAASLDAYREDTIRTRSRALQQASRSITRAWGDELPQQRSPES